ncbi:MAG: hypothetical protein NTY48_01690 [Candidatus Diapherotrites archaeon]|nr:hypothetical protein [Candidatus Diapherotrites archaeon]
MYLQNTIKSLDVSTNAPWLVVSPSSIVIDANSRESLNIKGLPTGIIASTYSIFAQSPDLTVSKSIAVSKLGDGVCHGFSAVPSVTSIDLTCCTGKVLEVNIKNTGFFNQEFKLSRVSPSWVSFSEESFSLLPNTEKKVFVYFSPDSNSAGAQTAVILVSNDNNVSVFVSVDLNVSSAKNFVIEKNLSLSTSVLDTSTNLLDTSSALGKIFLNIILRNDSNSGFVVNSILVKPVNGSIDFNAVVDFNKGVIVPAGKDFNAILVITFDSNKIKPKDFNAVFVFETSAGVFTKIQLVSLEKTPQSFSITGMFLAYSAPITAILFFGLLVLILLALRRRIDSGSESEE